MVQMTPADQKMVASLPGNDVCADCPVKRPDWASVSFGTLVCLDCSGVHRSLGVHISFVRSVKMDSWTDKQLSAMKMGGNLKWNNYLKDKGINPQRTKASIKAKYEHPIAQLYKEKLKARIEGRPEPTELPKPATKKPYTPAGGGGTDAQGMERLAGESDQQYIARQTRLRDEARARMAAKFGNSGGGSMGGIGSGSSRMQGIGSDPGYNGGGGGVTDSVVSGLGNAFNFAASIVNDEQTKQSITGLTSTVKSAGVGFWGGLTAGVATAAQAVAQPNNNDFGDGLADLQREFASKKTGNSTYAGFGSSSTGGGQPSSSNAVAGMAPGLPGEDPNGVGRLTGETDQQYIARQTRLRDEAKARMAAKFGSGGLSSAGSTSMSTNPQGGITHSNSGLSRSSNGSAASLGQAPGLPGEDPNGIERLTGESDDQYVARQTRLREEAKARMAAKFGKGGGAMGGVGSNSYASSSAPSSMRGGFGSAPASGNSFAAAPVSGNSAASFATPKRALTPPKKVTSDDFFSSFGT